MAELAEKSAEIGMKNRLLGERNKQIHSLERDLAVKEETIQKLRVQLEEADLSADQVCTSVASPKLVVILSHNYYLLKVLM